MEGKNYFLRRLKQFDGLTWLTPTLPILRQIYATANKWQILKNNEFHCHMRMNLQPYEENQICLAFFRGTGENVQHLALLNSEQDIVHKIDFTDIIDLFTAAKPEKRLF